jgi:hypothetical protein
MLKITRYVYMACDRTNVPQESLILGPEDCQDEASTIKMIESAWPGHAPVEKYNGWGKGNVYIGSLCHTFLVER